MSPASRSALRLLLHHARVATTHWAGLPVLADDDDPRMLLARLPTTTRADLRRDGFRMRSLGGDTSHWRLLRTTGTTGEPAEVVLDEHARATEAAVLARHIDSCLDGTGWRTRDLLHLTLHPGSTTRTQPAPWSSQGRAIKWNLIHVWQAGDRALARALRRLESNVVTMLPSVAELLALRLPAMGLGPEQRPALVALSGEALTEQARRRIADAFGCPITTLYTLAEAGIPASECTCNGGYHIEEQSTIVELLDEAGRPVPTGVEGEVVVTPLANRAMVLLRYRTGDRARWLGACHCGRATPRFELVHSRQANRLVSTSGQTVHAVRFAKLLAHLEVDQVELQQSASGTATVRYRAPRPMAAEVQAVVTSAMRAALGPESLVEFERVQDQSVHPRSKTVDDFGAEPACLTAEALADWLRPTLHSLTGLQAAALTGSILDPAAFGRFSDIDLVLLTSPLDMEACRDRDPVWLALAKRLQQHVPKLTVTIDCLDGLSQRAPLFACRLLGEQLMLVGRIDDRILPRPSRGDLLTQARHALQESKLALWHRLVSLPATPVDPPREAWIASKQALQAMRFWLTLTEQGPTAALAVLSAATKIAGCEHWLDEIVDAFEVAREHRPPPLEREATERYLAAARRCVRDVAAWVEQQSSEPTSC